MAQTAIYLSTAGMLLGYGVETAGAQTGDPNVAPATYTNVQGAKSISEISISCISFNKFKLAFTKELSISFSLPERNCKLQVFIFSRKVNLSMSSCNGVIIAISEALVPFFNNSSICKTH